VRGRSTALPVATPVDDPRYNRCFACGEPMEPWWWAGIPVYPHSDDPPRQWHDLCFERWMAFKVGWQIYGAGTITVIGPGGTRVLPRALYFANTVMP